LKRKSTLTRADKRTSLLALFTFLGINGIDFIVPESEAAAMILWRAAGEVSEENLALWVRNNWPKQ
jgi:death-on-curing protein